MNLRHQLLKVLTPFERFVHNYGQYIGLALMALVFAFLWAPIAVLIFMSFAQEGVLSFPPDSLTLDWYFTFLENAEARDATITSLQVSLVATPITVLLATILAYPLGRYDFAGKPGLQLLITLPLIVPLVVVGVALTLFFGFLNISTGYWTVVIAHVVRTLPFAALIIIPTFLSFDKALEEASMDLGANELATFRQVTLPNILPGIVAGGLLAFTISFNEFVYTYFVRDTATQTLPIYLWNRIRYGVTPEVNVISVFFLIVAVLLILLAISLTHAERVATRSQ